MSKVAFELRASEKDLFSGGSVSLSNGKSFDLGKALSQTSQISTSDPELIERLNEVEALKRVEPTESKPPTKSDKAA